MAISTSKLVCPYAHFYRIREEGGSVKGEEHGGVSHALISNEDK